MVKGITAEELRKLDEMIARARKAAEIIAGYDQERVDHLCRAVAAAVYDLKTWALLSDEVGELTYHENR